MCLGKRPGEQRVLRCLLAPPSREGPAGVEICLDVRGAAQPLPDPWSSWSKLLGLGNTLFSSLQTAWPQLHKSMPIGSFFGLIMMLTQLNS